MEKDTSRNQDADVKVAINDKVFVLDVTMCYALAVQVANSVDHLAEDMTCLSFRKPLVF